MEDVTIVLACDEYYLPYTAVTIQSIISNANPDRRYGIFIFMKTANVGEQSIRGLNSLFEQNLNFSLHIVDVQPFLEGYDFFVSRHVSVETYYRLLIPYVLSDLKKVIYMDGDMVCLRDIAELYDIDLGDNLIAACRDVAVAKYYYDLPSRKKTTLFEKLSAMEKPYDYFNAGLLIFNIQEVKKHIQLSEILELAVSREWECHDQDILNHLCEKKVLFLPRNWDAWSCPLPWRQALPKEVRDDFEDSEDHPYVLHYKPFQYWYYIPKGEFFWKYAALTPFYEIIIAQMKSKGLLITPIKKQIYADIRQGKDFGLGFIIKCFLNWLTLILGKK